MMVTQRMKPAGYATKHVAGWAAKRRQPVVVNVPEGRCRYVMLPDDEVGALVRSVAEDVFDRACSSVGLEGKSRPRLRFYAQFDDLDADEEQAAGRQLQKSFLESETVRGLFGWDKESGVPSTIHIRIGPHDSFADVAEAVAHEAAHAAVAVGRGIETKGHQSPDEAAAEEQQATEFGRQARAWYMQEGNRR